MPKTTTTVASTNNSSATTQTNETIKLSLNVTRVRPYTDNDGKTTINLYFDKKFRGYSGQGDERHPDEVDTIAFPRGGIVAQISNLNSDFAMFADCNGGLLEPKQLVLLLNGATMDIKRTHYSNGDIYTDYQGVERTVERDGEWHSTITKVSLNKRAKQLLENALTL